MDVETQTTKEKNWTEEDRNNTPRVNSKKKVEHCHLNRWMTQCKIIRTNMNTPRMDHLTLLKKPCKLVDFMVDPETEYQIFTGRHNLSSTHYDD